MLLFNQAEEVEWISNKTLGEQKRQWVKEFLVFHGFPKVALSITMGIHVTAVLSHGPQKNDFLASGPKN